MKAFFLQTRNEGLRGAFVLGKAPQGPAWFQIWGREVREGAAILSSLHHFNFFFFPPLLDAVVIRPGLQLQRQEMGVIPKQENLTVFLTFMLEFLRA